MTIRALFVVGALYDGILGLAFLFAAPSLFAAFGVAPPNHYGYVQFPALLLITFALVMFGLAWQGLRVRPDA